MLTTFWDLCPDIILEVCRYFSINQLLSSLYPDVLPNLFDLLKESHIRLHLSLTNDDFLMATILSLIDTGQVVSLNISSDDTYLNTFHAVKSVTLKAVDTWEQIIPQFHCLPLLQRLVLVSSSDLTNQVEDALKHVFDFRSLEYLELKSNDGHLLLSTNSITTSFSIRKLVLNTLCSQLTLSFLLNSLPRLHTLRIRTLMESAPNVRTQVGAFNAVPPALIYHSSLRIIDFAWYHPNMMNITLFLKGLPNLERCKLSGVMSPKELDGNFWYTLLTKTCVNLKIMNVNMLIWIDSMADEAETNFSLDKFFKRINFTLDSNNREKELLRLIGDFRRFDQ
jgi:hypothetical protein